MANDKLDIIAFYLPQYHPTKHNNEWWGKGFTEWTNVGKAKPLFKGHYQPKVPADLGYYDLRIPQVREEQAELAKEAGITGFCYYHYWFEEGKEELDFPFKEVIRLKKPDFPFCLCWANESWHSKFWNPNGEIQKRLLIEQKYLGTEDNIKHFNSLLEAFKDNRYIRINNKPIFMIYKPLEFHGIKEFIQLWQTLAKKNGLDGIYFIGYTLFGDRDYGKLKEFGFDAICSCRLGDYNKITNIFNKIRLIIRVKLGIPRIYDYGKIYHQFVSNLEKNEDVIPTLIPNWDHTPRSGKGGYLYYNSTPELFQKHSEEILNIVKAKNNSHKLCFLKSWNEWGEGNYMEPDLKYGHGFLTALKSAISNIFGTKQAI